MKKKGNHPAASSGTPPQRGIKKRQFKYTPEQIKAAIMLKNGSYSPSWISFKLHDQGIAQISPNLVGAIVNGIRFNSRVVEWVESEFAEELAVVSQTGRDDVDLVDGVDKGDAGKDAGVPSERGLA